MHDFDKCRFCAGYNVQEDWCEDTLCENHSDYCLDVNKIFRKADELNISVADVIALIRECNPPVKPTNDIYDHKEEWWRYDA